MPIYKNGNNDPSKIGYRGNTNITRLYYRGALIWAPGMTEGGSTITCTCNACYAQASCSCNSCNTDTTGAGTCNCYTNNPNCQCDNCYGQEPCSCNTCDTETGEGGHWCRCKNTNTYSSY